MGAFPIPDLWADNQPWLDAWHWLHRRAPQGMNGAGYVAETEVHAYAQRVGIDVHELVVAVDRCDEVYFRYQESIKPKGK